jgi:hypothetical protein
MIAPTKKRKARKSIPAWHAAFLSMLPAIERHARLVFRDRDPERRAELVQATIVNCYAAFARLVDRGKADVGFATPLAAYAVRQVRQGRMVGGRLNVRDVLSLYCQQTKQVQVGRLDRYDHEEDGWREILVEDRHASPAETAAIRIDYAAWLKTLGRRHRQIATKLALGETTGRVAKLFNISAGRISQLRRELEHSWQAFHGEPVAA